MKSGLFDWKGNEVQVGQEFYTVQTRTSFQGKFGMIFPQGDAPAKMIEETDEKQQERINEKLWGLHYQGKLIERDGRLGRVIEDMVDGEGVHTGYDFCFQFILKEYEGQLIAIKGISDQEPEDKNLIP